MAEIFAECLGTRSLTESSSTSSGYLRRVGAQKNPEESMNGRAAAEVFTEKAGVGLSFMFLRNPVPAF